MNINNQNYFKKRALTLCVTCLIFSNKLVKFAQDTILKYILKIVSLCILCSTVLATPVPKTSIQESSDVIHDFGEPVTLIFNLVSFDTNKGDLYSRITVSFPKDKIDSFGRLHDDYALSEEYTVDNSWLQMKKNTFGAGFNNTLKMTNVVSDSGEYLYPFDVHETKMKINVYKISTNNIIEAMPTVVNCIACSFDGFALDVNNVLKPDLSRDVTITIHRTIPHILFSIFINIIMVSVAIFVFVLSIRVTKLKFAPESSLLGFIGGLLFALPAVRNLQPEVPPLGVLIDYYGFFIAEILTSIALIIILVTWLIKPLHDGVVVNHIK